MDYNYLRDRIRHLLLKKSDCYNRSLANGTKIPSMTKIAKGLHKKCSLSERRILKYLSTSTLEKDLNITIRDLNALSNLNNTNLSNFFSYLNNDLSSINNLSSFDKEALSFLSTLDYARRRELSKTIFNSKQNERNKKLIDITLNLTKLPEDDLLLILKMTTGLKYQSCKINE